jgi:hypothetical protein
LDDDVLQRYFDGELSELEQESVKQRLSAHDEHVLRGLSRLHDMMVASAEEAGRDVDSNALFTRISRGVEEERRLGRGPELTVVPGTVRVKDRSTFWVVSAAVVAAAATLLLVLSPRATTPDEDLTATTGSTEGSVTVVEEEPAVTAMIEAPPGTEVEEVDFGTSTGTVFAVEGPAGQPLAVVWINDEETGRW